MYVYCILLCSCFLLNDPTPSPHSLVRQLQYGLLLPSVGNCFLHGQRTQKFEVNAVEIVCVACMPRETC